MYELLNKLKKKIEINDELLKVLIHSLREIIDFANYHNIPLYELHSIAKNLDKIQMLLREEETMARESMDFTKQCPICGKLNPEDAKYCAYCGTTLGVITRIRHDDKSPKDATEPLTEKFINKYIPLFPYILLSNLLYKKSHMLIKSPTVGTCGFIPSPLFLK